MKKVEMTPINLNVQKFIKFKAAAELLEIRESDFRGYMKNQGIKISRIGISYETLHDLACRMQKHNYEIFEEKKAILLKRMKEKGEAFIMGVSNK